MKIATALLVIISFLSAHFASSAPFKSFSYTAKHTHGVATLHLAVEGPEIQIHFTSPAADIIGFEHKATSEADMQRVKQAQSILHDANALFSLRGADCLLKDRKTNLPSSSAGKETHHHNHHQQHSEINVFYAFLCSKPVTNISVDVALFDAFISLKQIKAVWLSENKQGAKTLTPSDKTISL